VQNLAVDTKIVVNAPTNAGTWLFVSADDSDLCVRANKTSASVIEISRADIVQVAYPKHHVTAFGALFGVVAGSVAASTGVNGGEDRGIFAGALFGTFLGLGVLAGTLVGAGLPHGVIYSTPKV
jgi:hypothetical protein